MWFYNEFVLVWSCVRSIDAPEGLLFHALAVFNYDDETRRVWSESFWSVSEPAGRSFGLTNAHQKMVKGYV